MFKKKTASLILLLTLMISVVLCACDNNTNSSSSNTDKYEITNMSQIEYTKSQSNLVRATGLNLILPSNLAEVGQEITANCYPNITLENDYFYYIIDWGDGLWSYNGPYAYSSDRKAMGSVKHIYRKAGNYKVKAVGYSLSDGKKFGWTEEQTINVTEGEFPLNMLQKANSVCMSTYSDSNAGKNIADGDMQTSYKSAVSQPYDNQFIGYIFDDYYTLDMLEVSIPTDSNIFPFNISVDYTTDAGKTWYSLPKYYYVYPYMQDKYSINMNFPNPKGATLEFMLDGIVANGVRISSKQFALASQFERTLNVAEMRVYGDKQLNFYSSLGGAFDADLNNMWSIYGTAKTESSMYNSLRGAATNQDPFRSGMTMIASTEWFEWNGLKLNWTDFNEAITIHEQALVDARYGGDGFKKVGDTYVVDSEIDKATGLEKDYIDSVDDGFIWATESHPKHLGIQNHYTNNSAFIIACRDYLLTGNATEGFFERTNVQGQDMYTKLSKAAEYMLEVLDGKNGVMTIFDPRNSAKVESSEYESHASNYWDNYLMCGYKSAYENTLFYHAIKCMADIENFKGNSAKAEYYLNICNKIKLEFNKLFWDEQKGRYITSVDTEGNKIDFGITFINFYAVKYGLASDEQAKLIYDWIDGNRIIEGDSSTGDDIYNFVLSARSNTLDIASTGAPYYWWSHNGALPIGEGKWGQFGNVMQNGGTIFYITHYDIMGRFNVSSDNAFDRFKIIVDEFHKDELRRYPFTAMGGYQMGLLGEFPESGLVPLTYLTGFLGINPTAEGLKISANLPSDMEFGGVNSYMFGGREYSIEVNKSLSAPEIYKKGDKYIIKLPASDDYVITLDNKLVKV